MKLYSSLLDMQDVEAYVRTVARNAGLRVQWGDPNCTPMTDGKMIQMPRLTSKATPEEVIVTVGLAIHEAQGHVVHSDFKLLEETGLAAMNSNLGMLWNGAEDHRIEWLAAKQYMGDRLYLAELMRILNEKSIKHAEDAIRSGKGIPPTISKYLGPVINWEQSARSELFPYGGMWGGPRLSEEKDYQHWRAEWDKHPILVSMLRDAREIVDAVDGTAATLEVAKKAWELVYKGDPEKEIEEAQKRAQKAKEEKEKAEKEKGKSGKGKGDPEEGDAEEGEESGEGDEEGKGKGRPGDKEGKGDGDPSKDETLRVIDVKWQEVMAKVHGEGNLTGTGQHLDFSTYRPGSAYAPARQDQIEVVDFTNIRTMRRAY